MTLTSIMGGNKPGNTFENLTDLPVMTKEESSMSWTLTHTTALVRNSIQVEFHVTLHEWLAMLQDRSTV